MVAWSSNMLLCTTTGLVLDRTLCYCGLGPLYDSLQDSWVAKGEVIRPLEENNGYAVDLTVAPLVATTSEPSGTT